MQYSSVSLNTRSYRSPPPPRPPDQRIFGEPTSSHHAPTGLSAFVPDPLASGGGFHLLYDGADSVPLSGEAQLLSVNIVRSNGLSALIGHYLVETLPQPGLVFSDEHFVALGRQVLPMVAAADLEPGDLLGVVHVPLMRAPIDAIQGEDSVPALSPSTDVGEVAAVSEASLTTAAAAASPSLVLLARFPPEQHTSFLRDWYRLSPHLRDLTFDLHVSEGTPVAIEHLVDVPGEFPGVFFSKSKADFGSFSLRPFDISVPEDSAPIASRAHRINSIWLKRWTSISISISLPVYPTLDFPALEPSGGLPEKVWLCWVN